ncbi:AGAP003150-PA-like protein [Anopheles sinensis]|uniref:AGAP003150-PA-like protein n=1 Tax=Anopheles sinensis TaxID=74873 RepID=A0A084VRG6_ANOSI|nr:AGAP003150-PA-like protein [Anopheles sinensis]
MKCLAWIVLCTAGLFLLWVERSEALPRGCFNCARNRGFPQEKCCDECPVCRHNFDVEAPPDPGCRKLTRYQYDVEKITGCHKETYDRLDAAVEVLPAKGCRKSYQYHYDVEKPCDCNEENYDTYDFEVVSPKKEKKCQKVKLEAFADHPVRDHRTIAVYRPCLGSSEKKTHNGFLTNQGGFVCHCVPADQGVDGAKGYTGDFVGNARRPASFREQPVYIGDSSNPITYDQIKKHMDALPTSEYSPTTNDVIGNLTVLFYDIYQQKHRKNFTLPLKYGTRTVVEKGDGLQQYDIKPIEGEYQPPKLNRLASKGLRLMGRKIELKTRQTPAPRRNRIQSRP